MCWENRKYFSMVKAAIYITSEHIVSCAHPVFFHIAQCVECAQPDRLLITNTSEAMGIGRDLSSEKIAQAVALDNFNYCQKHIKRVLGCSKGTPQKM